ncbi:g-D-glutamyl-meso-diaminopimelate peptidase [Halobacillus karajensis]|uniref:Gamma-D-glutamyl-L-diamino acid endopeptidase 1 n=1 Tax=Halobacillus karajensis TaxID=195088 RepID=A0A024P518_9BACI|nr:M14 family metallopeptidase [Halobacillus karajensis]CDQ20402.1 Gamma-D-glutamyl-L-diamino acid endopeptidase 1 [Halobacillus karajensis]CDQ24129.1 Gamma-D-glutamyl-L-diamino acid endopeptidase 1 [Halobacillus karajensis]CDQ27607.1 Gamma-D-glutamyl-L-diamino acid endopeptidase 1 [Halobacillus karajensis]SEH92224.1 g-D-glutamyl-meso-diaminopimelate peptidase [Halobacillus karajensis]
MDVKVRSGDSLWYYSNLFNVGLDLIIDSNPEADPSSLQIGQTIRIPGYQTTQYRVQTGDTFWKIASERRISLDAIALLNPSVNPKVLQTGQTILLPVHITYRVVDGNRPYDFDLLTSDLNKLYALYPFIRRQTFGNSVMDKELVELQIGNGSKIVHWNGSFHANEWITTAVMMQFLNDYLLALTNKETIRGLEILPFYDQVTLSIVPMVDPDGVDLVLNGPPEGEYGEEALRINEGNIDFSDWKANIRGVDLNNQYPAKWEVDAARKPTSPAPRDFPGYQPLTEPETIAMAELAESRNFEKMLAFHTQGEVIFWGYEGLEPPRSMAIVNEFERVSGYEPIRYVDSFSGYKDWFIQEFRQPGFTVELGQGVNPLPLEQFDEIYQETIGIFLASLYM